MPYYIQLPDGRNVEFPDNYPRDQARAVAARMAREGQRPAEPAAQQAPAQSQPLTAEQAGRSGLQRNILDPAERGFQNLMIGTTASRALSPDSFFGLDPEDAAAAIARRQSRLLEIPQTEASQRAFREAEETGSVPGAVGRIVGSSAAVGDIALESLGTNPLAAPVGALANITPIPVLRQGIGAIAGALGFPTEYLTSVGSGVMEAARSRGVDVRDPSQLAALLREINASPELRDEIKSDALTRAGIISATDAAAGYGAGRVVTLGAPGRIGGGAAIQAAGGGLGEVVAQLATDGRITPVDVAAEIVGGAGMGALGNIRRSPPTPPPTDPGAGNLPADLRGAIDEYVANREPALDGQNLLPREMRDIDTPVGNLSRSQLLRFMERSLPGMMQEDPEIASLMTYARSENERLDAFREILQQRQGESVAARQGSEEGNIRREIATSPETQDAFRRAAIQRETRRDVSEVGSRVPLERDTPYAGARLSEAEQAFEQVALQRRMRRRPVSEQEMRRDLATAEQQIEGLISARQDAERRLQAIERAPTLDAAAREVVQAEIAQLNQLITGRDSVRRSIANSMPVTERDITARENLRGQAAEAFDVAQARRDRLAEQRQAPGLEIPSGTLAPDTVPQQIDDTRAGAAMLTDMRYVLNPEYEGGRLVGGENVVEIGPADNFGNVLAYVERKEGVRTRTVPVETTMDQLAQIPIRETARSTQEARADGVAPPRGVGSDINPRRAVDRQGPEASARQLGAEQAATQVEAEPSPADARLSRRTEAQKRINNLYLDKLRGMGAQGRLIRNGLVDALKNRSLSAEQVYGAFTAADVLAPLMPAGANHRIEFTKEILPNKQLAEAIARSGGNPNAALQGLRTRPSDAGLEGIITLSLAPDMMPYLRETAAHEAFHVLQDYYGKYDPQFKKLMDQGFRDGMMISDVDPTIRRKLEQARFPSSDKSYWQVLSGTLPNAITANEAQAYAFGSLLDASRRGTPMTGLKPAFARFVNFTKNFFSKLGSKLRGDGFQTAEEVLGRAGSEARTRFDQMATPTAGEGVARAEASARTIMPSSDLVGLGSRVRNATPSDVASKQFEIQYTQTADMITRGLQGLPIVGKRIKDTAGEDIIILMQDRMLPLGRMVDVVRESGGTVVDASDVRMTEELYSGRVGEAVDDRAKRIYKPVFDEMRRLNVSVKDIDAYLYARHAPESNAFIRSINEDPSKGSGMTDQKAAEIMKQLAPQKANLDRVAKLVDAIIADTNKTRFETGLTPDYSKLNSKTKYKHFVPLRGFADANIFDDKGVESLRAGAGQGFKIRGKEDRSRMGRTSQAADILANVILQNQETVIRSEKNRVGQSLLKLIQDNPEQAKGFARILEKAPVEPRIVNGKVKLVSSGLYKNRDDVMVVKEGGNEVAIEIYDERLAKALTGATGLGAENSSMVLRALAGVNRWLAMVNTTLNPEFVITNFVSDLQTANINIKQFDTKGLGRKIVSDVPMALAGVRAAIRGGDTSGKWSQAYEDFRRAGGTVEFLGLRDIDGKIKQINEEIMDSKGPLVKRPFKTMIKLFQDYNTVADNAIRLSTFQTLRDLGVSDAKAAQVAKNLTTNFNKAGQNRVLMNSLYLFYNASIQGTMAMANAIVRSKRVRKYVGGIIVAGFMQDIINSMMSDMDEDERKVYDKIPDHVLARSYVLMDPFGLSERGYYALPMPYGFNAFFNMGRNLARASRGEGEPMKTAGSIVMGFVDAFNPIGGTQSFLNFAAPTILDPLVDLRSNLDFANRPIVPEERGFGPASPESQRFWSNTFPPYVTVSQWLNQITGGTSVIPGQVDISPNTIKYLMNFATGAAGAFAERVLKLGFSTVPDMLAGDLEEVEVRDLPLLRKLYGNVTSRNDLQSFIENTNRISQIQREFKEAERFGDSERIERALLEYPNELAIAPSIEGLVRARGRITREMNLIRRDPNIDEDSRREILRALRQEAEMYVGQVNLLYNQSVDRR